MVMNSIQAGDRSIKDSEVRIGTGRGWAEWIGLLDAINAKKMLLTDIINFLVEAYMLERVWAQVIAVFYKWGV